MRTDYDRIYYRSTETPDSPSSVPTVTLADSGILSIEHSDTKLRITGCTSYVLTDMHLIFTTSQHLLKFIHLNSSTLDIPPDEPENDERCRSIERGAKLVMVMPSVYSLSFSLGWYQEESAAEGLQERLFDLSYAESRFEHLA